MEYLFGVDYKDVKTFALWKTGRRQAFSEKLCDIAESLVGAVPLSAGFKRQFSTLGLTYGTLQSQLGIEQAGNSLSCTINSVKRVPISQEVN